MKSLKDSLPKPEVIVSISAHWETNGSFITAMERPKVIYDFFGFSKELFEVEYPATGNPELARSIYKVLPEIHLESKKWGIDHGTWSLLKHIYPEADIPVVQLSIDVNKNLEEHYELAKKLKFLREQKVLVIGSGNIVHNLKKTQWGDDCEIYEWAIEFDHWVQNKILEKDHIALCQEGHSSESGRLSIPTWEHYIPLIYILGLSDSSDEISLDYEGFQNGSISMRSVRYY